MKDEIFVRLFKARRRAMRLMHPNQLENSRKVHTIDTGALDELLDSVHEALKAELEEVGVNDAQEAPNNA